MLPEKGDNKDFDDDAIKVPDLQARDFYWQTYRKKNTSIIVDFFHGLLRSVLTCQVCGRKSRTFSPFVTLSVPVPASPTGAVGLDQCLRQFTAEELLTGQDGWHCPKCKVQRTATKSLAIAKLSPLLVVHLKRFRFDGRWRDKIDTMVHYPMTLDMTPYLQHCAGETWIYDLYGVSVRSFSIFCETAPA